MKKIKILGLVVMAVMLLPNKATAQAPDTLWTKTFGGSGEDIGVSVAQTGNGGYIIAGWTYSYGTGTPDSANVYLIKTNANGNAAWKKTFGGSSEDYGYSVAQTSDGGYIVAGYTDSYGAGQSDVYLIKTEANGDTRWEKTYGGTGEDVGFSVAQTSDGGYIIAGATNSYGAGKLDVYLIKTAANGDMSWTKTYGGTGNDVGYSVAQTSDGGYIVAGWTDSYGAGHSDVYLIKTDANGDTRWEKTYGGAVDDVGFSVAQASNGGYIIAGWTYSFGAGIPDSSNVYIIKTAANGDVRWTKTYGGTGNDVSYSVAEAGDGGYIVAGYTDSYGAGKYDVYLIKTDANGDKLWTKTYGGTDLDGAFSVAKTSDAGYIIAGYTDSYGGGGEDIYLIRVAPDKGVEENSNLKRESSNLRLAQNPFSRTATISYQIPEKSAISLTVYDITGKEIKRLVAGVQDSGDHHLQLDMTGYAEGVYFIKLTAGKFSSVKKVIVLK